jgi:uncharacterized protein
MITDPIFYLCAVPAVLLFGMSKGGFGGGISVLSVPLVAMVISPVQAAAIMLPVLLVMDATALLSFRGQWHSQNLRIMIPGAIAGIVVGTLCFSYLSEDAVRLLIGVIALFFCINHIVDKQNGKAQQPNWLKGSFWSAIAGFTSFGIHAGAPPVSVYLLPQKLEKTLLMGTFAVFFAVVNAVKVIPYAWMGLLDSTNLMTSLMLIPLAPIGVKLGYYLLHKIEQTTVYRLCYFFLAVAGVKLSIEGLGGLTSA